MTIRKLFSASIKGKGGSESLEEVSVCSSEKENTPARKTTRRIEGGEEVSWGKKPAALRSIEILRCPVAAERSSDSPHTTKKILRPSECVRSAGKK